MKAFLVFAAAAFLIAGCSQRYRMTLTNGNSITTASKPKLNKAGSAYLYKDHTGKETWVSAGRVLEIAPE